MNDTSTYGRTGRLRFALNSALTTLHHDQGIEVPYVTSKDILKERVSHIQMPKGFSLKHFVMLSNMLHTEFGSSHTNKNLMFDPSTNTLLIEHPREIHWAVFDPKSPHASPTSKTAAPVTSVELTKRLSLDQMVLAVVRGTIDAIYLEQGKNVRIDPSAIESAGEEKRYRLPLPATFRSEDFAKLQFLVGRYGLHVTSKNLCFDQAAQQITLDTNALEFHYPGAATIRPKPWQAPSNPKQEMQDVSRH